MMKDRAIVTMEGEWETAPKLSSGTSLNDLQWPLQGPIIQRQITWKWYIQLHLQWPTNRKSYMVYRTAPFPMTLNNPYPQFQGHAIVWRWISQKRYDIHSFNEILIGTYTRPTQQCHFEWPWVTLSDLAKYSVTRSVARLSATAELLVPLTSHLTL